MVVPTKESVQIKKKNATGIANYLTLQPAGSSLFQNGATEMKKETLKICGSENDKFIFFFTALDIGKNAVRVEYECFVYSRSPNP